MLNVYIMAAGILVTLFGIVNFFYALNKHNRQAQKNGRGFIIFGLIIVLIGGVGLYQQKEAKAAVKRHQEKTIREQLYDSQIVHLGNKQLDLNKKQPHADVYVAKYSVARVHRKELGIDDVLIRNTTANGKYYRINFVMTGTYMIYGFRGKEKVQEEVVVENSKSSTQSEISSSSTTTSIVSTQTPVSSIYSEPYSNVNTNTTSEVTGVNNSSSSSIPVSAPDTSDSEISSSNSDDGADLGNDTPDSDKNVPIPSPDTPNSNA